MSTKESKEDVEMADTESTQQQTGAGSGSATAASTDDAAAAAAANSKKKKAKSGKTEVMEVDPNYEGQRFKIGELIYANYAEGKQWFEAKVLKVEKRKDLIYYFLHYQGWGDKFNDWRPYHLDSELMKHDEAGKKIFDESKLKLKLQSQSTKKGASGAAAASSSNGDDKKKKRKLDDDETVEDEVSVGGASGEVKLKISGLLKKQLIVDWESVTRHHRLVTLPRPISVHALLEEFEQSKLKQESSHQMCKEVVNGLEQYFEKALGTVLLYRFERAQYNQQIAKIEKDKAAAVGRNETPDATPLSKIYGAEHLLRLFVKLPNLLAFTKLETKEAVVLGSKLNDFIKWLSRKAEGGSLFQLEYEATDQNYAQESTKIEQELTKAAK